MLDMQTTPQTQPEKKKGANKLVLGFAAVVASAVVGTTGLAAAQSMNNGDKPSKEQCAAAGFNNYGQCVEEWAHEKNRPGGGYGGGSVGTTTNANLTADTNVGLELNDSSNNVVSVILNLFR